MVFTSYYSNLGKILVLQKFKKEDCICISAYTPNLNFKIKSCSELTPSLGHLWNYKNKEISWEEYKYFFERKLWSLDYRFWDNFDKIFENKILLCYEKDNTFCHRKIVADFFEMWTGKYGVIQEIK